jgi:hypothetical protein
MASSTPNTKPDASPTKSGSESEARKNRDRMMKEAAEKIPEGFKRLRREQKERERAAEPPAK